ncbi:MAG: MFS transporter [Halothiobacillaceae bacterium]|nr:MFS transporter [Halothiobacillaceae bacterium]HER35231.1 MFS transporter [Halothiobacillaceae bacterium]
MRTGHLSTRGFSPGLSLWQVLAYGAPGLPLALMGIPLYVYLPPFYANELGLGLAAVGMALMLTRLWDVITDPLVGHLADRVPGRHRRKWLMGSGIPLLIVSLWFLLRPGDDVGLWHLYLWGLAAFLGWTLIQLPYASLGAEADPSPHGRTRLAASREGLALIGTVLAASLPVLIGSEAPGTVLLAVFWLMALSLPLAFLVMAAGAPEPARHRAVVDWRRGWPLLIGNRHLRALLGGYFLNNLANGIPAALFLMFVADRLGAEGWLGWLLLLYFGAGIAALPAWTFLARRIGKRRSWGASILLATVSFAFAPLLGTGDVAWFALICVTSGLSLGADMALPASIQADIAGLDAEAGGGDRAGLFFGLLGLATKLALAVAVGLGYGLLALAGFESGDADTTALALTYGSLPVVFKLAAAWLVFQRLTDTEPQLEEAPR